MGTNWLLMRGLGRSQCEYKIDQSAGFSSGIIIIRRLLQLSLEKLFCFAADLK